MAGFSVPVFTWFYQSQVAADGSVFVYKTGTTTLQTIYADGGLVTPLSNPLTLDANGQCKFYVSGTVSLRLDGYTSTNTFIETIDPVYPVGSAGVGSVVYQATNLTLSPTNAGNNIVATANITIALPLTTGFSNSFSVQLNAQGGTITLTPNAADKIQGGAAGASFVLAKGQSGELWTDGAGNWGINFLSFTASQVVNNPIIGSTRNAFMSIPTASATATFTADGIVVATALNGVFTLLPSFSQPLNLATTGIGGMDSGAAPISGFVSIYAAWNGALSGIFACNATSSSGSIYSGTHLPSGYTSTALIGIVPTNASSLFQPGLLIEREWSWQTPVMILNSVAGVTSLTVQSVSAAVPVAARSSSGLLYTNQSGNSAGAVMAIAADSSGTAIQQNFVSIGSTISNNPTIQWLRVPFITAQVLYWRSWNTTASCCTMTVGSYTF